MYPREKGRVKLVDDAEHEFSIQSLVRLSFEVRQVLAQFSHVVHLFKHVLQCQVLEPLDVDIRYLVVEEVELLARQDVS